MVEHLKEKTSLRYLDISREVEIPHASLTRWRSRLRRGLPLWEPPGPKKVPRFDLAGLEEEIRRLSHRRKRTRGAGALERKYAPDVSRRKLMAMVKVVRQEMVSEIRESQTRIEWRVAGVVSSMDETERPANPEEGNVTLLSSLELGARYVLPPLLKDGPALGTEVADHLRSQFEIHGAPLFLKRDNGANLNAEAVNQVLEEFGVLPLNSPAYYSPYNGGMERSHQDVDAAIAEILEKHGKGGCASQEVTLAIHELNHRPRRVLKGKVPCQVYHGPDRRKYGKQERRIVYDWMKEKTAAILEAVPKTSLSFEAAWRSAAQVWLESQGVIRVHKPRKVSPHFFRNRYHK